MLVYKQVFPSYFLLCIKFVSNIIQWGSIDYFLNFTSFKIPKSFFPPFVFCLSELIYRDIVKIYIFPRKFYHTLNINDYQVQAEFNWPQNVNKAARKKRLVMPLKIWQHVRAAPAVFPPLATSSALFVFTIIADSKWKTVFPDKERKTKRERLECANLWKRNFVERSFTLKTEA